MKSLIQKLAFSAIVMFALEACNLDQYNNSDLKKIRDVREGDIYVYGIKGDSARQLRQQYPDDPNAAKRVKAIREKFFSVSNGSNLQDGTPAPDTTKNITKQDGKQPAKAENKK
ncbi:MAG: hypothetical protein RMJ97_05470 [Raineya sp.]|nr:hypothetical protein [Raineya sp.]MDW8296319.1 hypothetical protein [Raineya sp.]